MAYKMFLSENSDEGMIESAAEDSTDMKQCDHAIVPPNWIRMPEEQSVLSQVNEDKFLLTPCNDIMHPNTVETIDYIITNSSNAKNNAVDDANNGKSITCSEDGINTTTIYLAGYDDQIFKLMNDIQKHNQGHEILVYFYLYLDKKFCNLGNIYTDKKVLQSNILKYTHYFCLGTKNKDNNSWCLDNIGIIIPKNTPSKVQVVQELDANSKSEHDVVQKKIFPNCYEFMLPKERDISYKDIYIDLLSNKMRQENNLSTSETNTIEHPNNLINETIIIPIEFKHNQQNLPTTKDASIKRITASPTISKGEHLKVETYIPAPNYDDYISNDLHDSDVTWNITTEQEKSHGNYLSQRLTYPTINTDYNQLQFLTKSNEELNKIQLKSDANQNEDNVSNLSNTNDDISIMPSTTSNPNIYYSHLYFLPDPCTYKNVLALEGNQKNQILKSLIPYHNKIYNLSYKFPNSKASLSTQPTKSGSSYFPFFDKYPQFYPISISRRDTIIPTAIDFANISKTPSQSAIFKLMPNFTYPYSSFNQKASAFQPYFISESETIKKPSVKSDIPTSNAFQPSITSKKFTFGNLNALPTLLPNKLKKDFQRNLPQLLYNSYKAKQSAQAPFPDTYSQYNRTKPQLGGFSQPKQQETSPLDFTSLKPYSPIWTTSFYNQPNFTSSPPNSNNFIIPNHLRSYICGPLPTNVLDSPSRDILNLKYDLSTYLKQLNPIQKNIVFSPSFTSPNLILTKQQNQIPLHLSSKNVNYNRLNPYQTYSNYGKNFGKKPCIHYIHGLLSQDPKTTVSFKNDAVPFKPVELKFNQWPNFSSIFSPQKTASTISPSKSKILAFSNGNLVREPYSPNVKTLNSFLIDSNINNYRTSLPASRLSPSLQQNAVLINRGTQDQNLLPLTFSQQKDFNIPCSVKFSSPIPTVYTSHHENEALLPRPSEHINVLAPFTKSNFDTTSSTKRELYWADNNVNNFLSPLLDISGFDGQHSTMPSSALTRSSALSDIKFQNQILPRLIYSERLTFGVPPSKLSHIGYDIHPLSKLDGIQIKTDITPNILSYPMLGMSSLSNYSPCNNNMISQNITNIYSANANRKLSFANVNTYPQYQRTLNRELIVPKAQDVYNTATSYPVDVNKKISAFNTNSNYSKQLSTFLPKFISPSTSYYDLYPPSINLESTLSIPKEKNVCRSEISYSLDIDKKKRVSNNIFYYIQHNASIPELRADLLPTYTFSQRPFEVESTSFNPKENNYFKSYNSYPTQENRKLPVFDKNIYANSQNTFISEVQPSLGSSFNLLPYSVNLGLISFVPKDKENLNSDNSYPAMKHPNLTATSYYPQRNNNFHFDRFLTLNKQLSVIDTKNKSNIHTIFQPEVTLGLPSTYKYLPCSIHTESSLNKPIETTYYKYGIHFPFEANSKLSVPDRNDYPYHQTTFPSEIKPGLTPTLKFLPCYLNLRSKSLIEKETQYLKPNLFYSVDTAKKTLSGIKTYPEEQSAFLPKFTTGLTPTYKTSPHSIKIGSTTFKPLTKNYSELDFSVPLEADGDLSISDINTSPHRLNLFISPVKSAYKFSPVSGTGSSNTFNPKELNVLQSFISYPIQANGKISISESNTYPRRISAFSLKAPNFGPTYEYLPQSLNLGSNLLIKKETPYLKSDVSYPVDADGKLSFSNTKTYPYKQNAFLPKITPGLTPTYKRSSPSLNVGSNLFIPKTKIYSKADARFPLQPDGKLSFSNKNTSPYRQSPVISTVKPKLLTSYEFSPGSNILEPNSFTPIEKNILKSDVAFPSQADGKVSISESTSYYPSQFLPHIKPGLSSTYNISPWYFNFESSTFKQRTNNYFKSNYGFPSEADGELSVSDEKYYPLQPNLFTSAFKVPSFLGISESNSLTPNEKKLFRSDIISPLQADEKVSVSDRISYPYYPSVLSSNVEPGLASSYELPRFLNLGSNSLINKETEYLTPDISYIVDANEKLSLPSFLPLNTPDLTPTYKLSHPSLNLGSTSFISKIRKYPKADIIFPIQGKLSVSDRNTPYRFNPFLSAVKPTSYEFSPPSYILKPDSLNPNEKNIFKSDVTFPLQAGEKGSVSPRSIYSYYPNLFSPNVKSGLVSNFKLPHLGSNLFIKKQKTQYLKHSFPMNGDKKIFFTNTKTYPYEQREILPKITPGLTPTYKLSAPSLNLVSNLLIPKTKIYSKADARFPLQVGGKLYVSDRNSSPYPKSPFISVIKPELASTPEFTPNSFILRATSFSPKKKNKFKSNIGYTVHADRNSYVSDVNTSLRQNAFVANVGSGLASNKLSPYSFNLGSTSFSPKQKKYFDLGLSYYVDGDRKLSVTDQKKYNNVQNVVSTTPHLYFRTNTFSNTEETKSPKINPGTILGSPKPLSFLSDASSLPYSINNQVVTSGTKPASTQTIKLELNHNTQLGKELNNVYNFIPQNNVIQQKQGLRPIPMSTQIDLSGSDLLSKMATESKKAIRFNEIKGINDTIGKYIEEPDMLYKILKERVVTIPLKNIGLVKYEPTILNNAYSLNTEYPNIGLKVWPATIKIVKAKIVFEADEIQTLNFMPVVKEQSYFTPSQVQNIVKDFVTKFFGEPIIVNNVYNVYQPYAIVSHIDENSLKNDTIYILWPAACNCGCNRIGCNCIEINKKGLNGL